MRFIQQLVIPTILIIFLASCGKRNVADKLILFPENQWNRFDFAEAEVVITDTECEYELSLEIVNTKAYAYDFLPLNITLIYPDETIRSLDTEIRLQDKSLRWLGTEKDGLIYTSFSPMKMIRFNTTGNITIRIENKLSKYTLENIHSLRIRVDKSKD